MKYFVLVFFYCFKFSSNKVCYLYKLKVKVSCFLFLFLMCKNFVFWIWLKKVNLYVVEVFYMDILIFVVSG